MSTHNTLSVAVSSGGMKGAFTLGALHGLQNTQAQIIELVGSSSGSLNAAYFVAGQTDVARDAYRHLISTDFIYTDRGMPKMDIELAWRLIFGANSPFQLDMNAVMSSDVELKIPLLNIDTGREEVFSNRDEQSIFTAALKAAIAVPVWYGDSVVINGQRYIDGGVVNPLPLSLISNPNSRVIGVSSKQRPFSYIPSGVIFSQYAQRNYGSTRRQALQTRDDKVSNIEAAQRLAVDRQALIIQPEILLHQLINTRSLVDKAFIAGEQAAAEMRQNAAPFPVLG